MSRIIQSSLASGIWGRDLDGRVDLERYPASLRELENMYVTKYGGVSNRPGFQYVANAYDNTNTAPTVPVTPSWPRFKKFEFGVGQNYILSFHDQIMRVFREGGLVLRNLRTTGFSWTVSGSGTSNYYCTVDSPVAEFGGLDIPGAQFVYQQGVALTEGTVGALSPGEWAYGDVDGLGFNTLYIRLSDSTDPDSKADGYVQVDFQMYTGLTDDQVSALDQTQSFDELYLSSEEVAPRKLVRFADDRWEWELLEFGPAIDKVDMLDVLAVKSGHVLNNREIYYNVSAIDENGDESYLADLVSTTNTPKPNGLEVTVDYPWPNNAYVRFFWNAIVNSGVYTWTVSGAAANEYYVTKVIGGAPLSLPASIYEDVAPNAGVPEEMTGGTLGALNPSEWAYGDNDTLGFSTIYVRLNDSTNPSTKANGFLTRRRVEQENFNVWKNNRGQWTWVNTSQIPYFLDDNIEGDTGFTPRVPGNDFSVSGDWPRALAIFQQRLMFGGTDNGPQTVYGSTLGNLLDFSIREPLSDDDAIEATLDAPGLHIIQHMLPQRKLLVFTDQTMHAFDHGANSDAITPTNLEFRIQDYIGCSSDVQPVPVDNDVVYASVNEKRVYATRYRIEGDAYTSEEITLHIPDEFDTRSIKRMAYQRTPENIIWCLMTDGTLMSLTWLPEQNVAAWANHSIDGKIKDIEVIRESDSLEYLYLSVRRSGISYVERMYNREFQHIDDAVFLDSSLTTEDKYDVTGIVFSGGNTYVDLSTITPAAGRYFKMRDISSYEYVGTDPEYTNRGLDDSWFMVGSGVFGTAFEVLKTDGTNLLESELQATGNDETGTLRLSFTTMNGYTHLANKTVTVLADGSVYPDQSVNASGQITLPSGPPGYVTAHAGFGYVSSLKTNRLEINSADGQTVQTRKKSISKVWLRLKDTKGGKVGPAPIGGNIDKYIRAIYQPDSQSWKKTSDQSAEDFEQIIDSVWDTGGMVAIEQDQPYPFSLLALIMEVKIERA